MRARGTDVRPVIASALLGSYGRAFDSGLPASMLR
jgi:hypothetical protein